jgi:hypothetical protein
MRCSPTAASVAAMATGLFMLAGCANSPTSRDATASSGMPVPLAAQPTAPEGWSRPGRPASELPEPIQTANGRSTRLHTAEAVVMDTRDFPVQIQVSEPWAGPVELVKNYLPKHGRDKSLPTLDAQPMPEGQIGDARGASGTGLGFPAIAQTPWTPPDPTLAVGPTHIVETVNSAIAFYTKDGVLQFSAQLGSPGSPGFFEGQGAGNFCFDPKCFYDQKTGRFVVTVLEVYGSTEAYIDIAVSDDSNPNGVWYKYRTWAVINIEGGTFWVDYPGFGFDDEAFYVTGNLFQLNGGGPGFGGPLIRAYDKTPMLSGQPAQFRDYVPRIDGSMQAAQTHGPSPRPYFVTQAASNAIRLWTVVDPLGPGGAVQNTTVITAANASGPSGGAVNPGGGSIDTLDGRFINVDWRDGKLYTAQGISAPGNRTRARWYEINTNGWPDSGTAPLVAQQGNVTGPGLNYFYPAIATDRFGRVGMVMARAAAEEFAGIWVTGREPGDAAGEMSEPVRLAVGDVGTSGRWGDYFDIAVDPNDDRTFWVVGQYPKNFGWQSWIGSFQVGCPGDENGDGQVNFFDLSQFLAAYNAQNSTADIAPPFGVVDFFDVSLYLIRYGEGCP